MLSQEGGVEKGAYTRYTGLFEYFRHDISCTVISIDEIQETFSTCNFIVNNFDENTFFV